MSSVEPALLRTSHAWITTLEGSYVVSSARSPVIELIERIYASESARPKSRARSILRNRIMIDREPTYAEREAVKVAAKRIAFSAGPPPRDSLELPEVPPLEMFSFEWKHEPLTPGTPLPENEIFPLLEALQIRPGPGSQRWARDRPVSAALLDSHGKLLSFAWNTNGVIRTRHAEWNLCAQLASRGQKIPAGARLFVSLKPCRMCAARIWESAEDPSRLSVLYFENDPGPLAQETLLDSASLARRRYLGIDHPHFRTTTQYFVADQFSNSQ